MKLLPLCLAGAATALCAESPLPRFDDTRIAPPPLSLRELMKKQPKPQAFDAAPPGFANGAPGPHLLDSFPMRRTAARVVPPSRNFAVKSAPGGMPILEPNPSLDAKIVIKEPDPNLDLRMVIRPSMPALADAHDAADDQANKR